MLQTSLYEVQIETILEFMTDQERDLLQPNTEKNLIRQVLIRLSTEIF